MNWSRELVARCIPQSRIKRSYTREVAPQSAKQLPSKCQAIHFFWQGWGWSANVCYSDMYIHPPPY